MFDSKVQPRDGEIWLHLTGMICPWAGNLTANFWKISNPHPLPTKNHRRTFCFLVLLAILLDKTYIQLRVNYRPSLQLFQFYVFPLFFQHEWKPGRRWRPKHQTERAGNYCCSWWGWLCGQNTSPTMLSIFSALQASVTSSIKVTVLTFLVKNCKMKLTRESIFWEYAKKLEVKPRTRSRPRPWI